MNRGEGAFEAKPTTFSGLDGSGICGEAADLNNSGPALSMARYESKVYWNTGLHGGKENHWLRLRFSGVKDAELIGARVELTAAGNKQYRWIHPNHSYKSGGALEAHVGLGMQTKADVKVALPNGKSIALAAAGVPQPTDKPLDGVNMLPFLTGEKQGRPHGARHHGLGGGGSRRGERTRPRDWNKCSALKPS